MASTSAGARLTERHRRDQLGLRAAALRELLGLWPALDPRRLDETSPLWVRLAVQLVLRWRGESARAAQDYYRMFRAAEIGEIFVPAVEPPPVDTARVAASLVVTGPVRIKWLTEHGDDPDDAARVALRDVSAAAGRHVMDGGRAGVDAAARADARAIGWARVTDGDPCAFCAMLASRGYVYSSREAALRSSTRSGLGAGHRYHDGCGCTAEPRFTRGAPLPGRGQEWARLWDDSTAGLSGRDARLAFRRAYEGRTPSAASAGASPNS